MPRLSFTLRDVFFMTLVAGMGIGWWIDRDGFEQDRKSSAIRAEQLLRVALEGGCLERTADGEIVRPPQSAE